MKKCKEFTFGGCEGNGNRFSSKDECETVCFFREVPKSRLGFCMIIVTKLNISKEAVRSIYTKFNTKLENYYIILPVLAPKLLFISKGYSVGFYSRPMMFYN